MKRLKRLHMKVEVYLQQIQVRLLRWKGISILIQQTKCWIRILMRFTVSPTKAHGGGQGEGQA